MTRAKPDAPCLAVELGTGSILSHNVTCGVVSARTASGFLLDGRFFLRYFLACYLFLIWSQRLECDDMFPAIVMGIAVVANLLRCCATQLEFVIATINSRPRYMLRQGYDTLHLLFLGLFTQKLTWRKRASATLWPRCTVNGKCNTDSVPTVLVSRFRTHASQKSFGENMLRLSQHASSAIPARKVFAFFSRLRDFCVSVRFRYDYKYNLILLEARDKFEHTRNRICQKIACREIGSCPGPFV